PSGAAVSLSATQLAFGSQLLGTTSANQSINITSTGNAPVAFDSISVSGDFSKVSDTCTGAATPPNPCTVTVNFKPAATGGRAGAITISDNASGNPQSVTLSGNGTDITIAVPPGGSNTASVSAG